MAQADTLARALGLSATDRLLDIGTGRGELTRFPGHTTAVSDRLILTAGAAP
jgi:cyclopropane fatty-acyl-phospholipid synthase-like methyltransferase